MNLYPAIDIYHGQAVRLRQGQPEETTIYGSPLEMAQRWNNAGARWLHVVDLDGAFAGRPCNIRVIEEIRSECPQIAMQVGGGIRDMVAVESILNLGIERVILGTAAVEDPHFLRNAVDRFGSQIAVGIDARDQTIQLAGWTESANVTALDFAVRIEEAGVNLIIYTDISRDGELKGINVEANQEMLESTGLQVIASGGIGSLEDLMSLKDLAHPRLEGAIIGKALYEGCFQLEAALAEAGN